MTLSTSDVDQVSPVVNQQKRFRRFRWSTRISILLLFVLFVGDLFASHYQPIVFVGGLGMSHPVDGHQRRVTQEFLLRNTGPVGVTVVGIASGVNYGLSSQARFSTSRICPPITSRGGDCRQNTKTGLLEGIVFHSFSLTTDSSRGVLLRYEFSCISPGALGTALGTVTLPVTYRFLWFTHTIMFSESADNGGPCSPE
jgi:hypothetical protein